MGLAGPSKKRKISHDPNNTKWTRSTGFGHRMLTSQGWAPGTILGPDPNNPHHTVASQVGIKVMLKDDTLGLGCKGNQEDTCTGLGDLQSLLGRLNGKTDESVKSEEDTRRKMWIEGRYGMRFVRGEVLESTWVTKGLKKEVKEVKDESDEEMKDASEQETKSADATDEEEGDESESSKTNKDKSKEKNRRDRESKKKKRKSSDSEDDEDDDSSSSSSQDRKSDKAKRKADKALRKAEKQAKRERKEAKRLRKDEKRRAKAEKKALKSAIAASSAPSSTASTPPAMPSAELEPVIKPAKKSKSLPNSLHTSGTSTPVNGRHALRSKWIAQKRMAVMDAKALNEILMIKAA
ncbi:telomerase inhibitor [Orbilia blumenaviensis]|uniref:Telomerase inhibitor n=1 Tax=Orbilia blumenaviensis TaxID=1796055 RepID=A0AAV9V3J7_9PEZI